MKVVILGLDSLDATRVRNRYDLPALELEESAKVDLGGLEGVEVHTNVIWPIILDGNHPHDSVSSASKMELLSRVARTFGVPEPIRRRIGGAFDKLDLSDSVGRQMPIEDTFLGQYPTIVPISVPGIGEMAVVDRLRTELGAQLDPDRASSARTFWQLCELEHEIKRAATVAAIKHTDVVMSHFYALDAVQHVAQNHDEQRVEAWYDRYAELVDELLTAFEDALLFLLSDHGMEDGLHGPQGKGVYAYAACNQQVGLRDGMTLADLNELLADAVGQVPHQGNDSEFRIAADTDRHEHLQDLGYL